MSGELTCEGFFARVADRPECAAALDTEFLLGHREGASAIRCHIRRQCQEQRGETLISYAVLDVLRRKIAELQSMIDTLEELVARYDGSSRPDCPVIVNFQGVGHEY